MLRYARFAFLVGLAAAIPAFPQHQNKQETKDENKKKANDWLNQILAGGSTDPIPGIVLAFRQRPRLIYLLTDGDFPDNDKVLSKFRDRVLFIKGNLNASAIASLKGTEVSLGNDIDALIKEMEASIKEADDFIAANKAK